MLYRITISLFLIYGLTSSGNRMLLQIPPNAQPNPNPNRPVVVFPGDPVPPNQIPAEPPAAVNPTPLIEFEYGAYGQKCPITATSSSNQCQSARDVVTDGNTGTLECNADGDCCMCSAIVCGLDMQTCNALRIGPSAALGVRDIQVIGSDTGVGAIIECYGANSCKGALIEAKNVAEIACFGESACQDATIIVVDPSPDFSMDCPGINACNGLRIVIEFTVPIEPCPSVLDPALTKTPFMIGGVDCGNDFSCKGLDITVNNNGCDAVIIDEIGCLGKTSCNGARFNLIGDVDILGCQCGLSCEQTVGLEKCYRNAQKLECSDPEQCQGRVASYYNPANYFEFVCAGTRSCEGSQFQLILNQNAEPHIRDWKGFIMGGQFSATNALITISNSQGVNNIGAPIVLNVEFIDCGGYKACEGTTFVKGQNVDIGRVVCSAGSCMGCTIKETLIGPGVPCDPDQVPAIGV